MNLGFYIQFYIRIVFLFVKLEIEKKNLMPKGEFFF